MEGLARALHACTYIELLTTLLRVSREYGNTICGLNTDHMILVKNPHSRPIPLNPKP